MFFLVFALISVPAWHVFLELITQLSFCWIFCLFCVWTDIPAPDLRVLECCIWVLPDSGDEEVLSRYGVKERNVEGLMVVDHPSFF